MRPKTLAIAVIVLAVAVILIIYSKVDNNTASNTPETPDQSAVTEQTTASRPESRPSSRQGRPTDPDDWADQIDTYLADDSVSNKQAVLGLLAIALKESAPMEARQDALEHALNLVEDEDFGIILKAFDSGKAALPAPLAQIILDDTYNRPDDIHLTTCIMIMRKGYSDLVEEAIEQLEFFTDEEHDDNIDAWEDAVKRRANQQDDVLNTQ